MKTRSFLTAFTSKTAVLLIGAVIAGLAIYGVVTKTIPGPGLFRDAPQTPQQTLDRETRDGLGLNDSDDGFELAAGTDFKSVPYLTPTDVTPAAGPQLPGTGLKPVPDSEYNDETLVAGQALTGQTGAGAEAGDTTRDLSTSAGGTAAALSYQPRRKPATRSLLPRPQRNARYIRQRRDTPLPGRHCRGQI